jgi:hypothetical protein
VQVSRVQPARLFGQLRVHAVDVARDALLDFLAQGLLPLGGEGGELLDEAAFPVVGKLFKQV